MWKYVNLPLVRPSGEDILQYLNLYSAGRFIISTCELVPDLAPGLNQAQFTILVALAVIIPVLVRMADRPNRSRSLLS